MGKFIVKCPVQNLNEQVQKSHNVGSAKYKVLRAAGKKVISQENTLVIDRVASRVHALRHNRTPTEHNTRQ
jgi:hypothetical protein